jgi:hypothetical protein
MTSENNNDKILLNKDQDGSKAPEATTKDISSLLKLSPLNNLDGNDDEYESTELLELNSRIKKDFMSNCLSYFQEDDEARQYVQTVWNKYLHYVGDVAMVNENKHFSIQYLLF